MDFIIDTNVFKGHDNYFKIMKMMKDPNLDVSTSSEFQSAYTGYYFPAPKSKNFKTFYFSYLQQCRGAHPSYREIIQAIYDNTNEVHYSFSSKLLHTIDPNCPILDQHVLRLLGFQVAPSKLLKADDANYQKKKDIDAKKRIEYYCWVFDTVSKEYKRYENEAFTQDAIARFDALSPIFKCIPYTKKVDMLLFRLRDERSASVLDYLFATK